MMILLAALSAISSSPGEKVREASRLEGELPVRLWMSNDRRYREGDRVRLQVDADTDGFLLVLNLDPNGRLRVLFPLDPRDDTRIQAGRRYEVRSEASDAAFRAGGDGTGVIYTAVSEEPWRFDEIVLADRWDYTRLEIDPSSTDPEPEITEIVQRLAGPRGFDYDVMGYRVYGESTYSTYNTYVYPGGPTYIYDDYLYCNNWNWRYDGCRRWPFDGGWSFGLGFYNPYYYGYNSYRYRYGYGYPYFPSRPFPSGRAPVLVGRPRNYTVVPRGALGSGITRGTIGSRGFGGSVTGPARGPNGVSAPEYDGRARGPARRAGGAVERGSDRGPDISSRGPAASAPPARRSRGGESYNAPPARGPDRADSYRGNSRPERVGRPERAEPSGREAPRARSETREAPRARSESSREAPRERSQPARREPERASAPPASRDHGQRQSAPQASSGGNRGNGGGGGHSRPRGRP